MHSDILAVLHLILSYQLSEKMSSGSSVQSTSSLLTSTVSTASQDSLNLGFKPGLPPYAPETDGSYSHSSSVSASSVPGAHAKLNSPSLSSSSDFRPSRLLTVDEKQFNPNSGAHAAGHKKKSKSKKGCISGISLDLHYKNLLTTSGRGRSTLGTGSGAPAGCDLM